MSNFSPQNNKPVSVRLVQGQEVSLGCGTLILIALIVLFCSGFGTRQIESQLKVLHDDVQELKTGVEEQNKLLEEIRNELKGQQGKKE